MEQNDYKYLQEQIEQAKRMSEQFESQSKMFEATTNNIINSLEGDDKSRVMEFKNMSERVISMAKSGKGDYMSLINEMTAKIKREK